MRAWSPCRPPTILQFPFERLLAAITPRTKIIAIANPNSPSGSVATRAQLLEIAARAPHAVLLVDEAYFHFHGETVIDLVGVVPNLIVARTFSKAYGLAGLRLGLLAGPVELMRWVRRVLSPYSVNSLALACLPPALEDTAYLDWYVGEVLAARTEFEAALDAAGSPPLAQPRQLRPGRDRPAARGVCAPDARRRRAGPRPLQRSRLRWPRAHHHRNARADAAGRRWLSMNAMATSANWKAGSDDDDDKQKSNAKSASRPNAARTSQPSSATPPRRASRSSSPSKASGQYKISTGIRFFDHMLELFTRHGAFDLELKCDGDLDVDQHHTVEDVGIALGEAFDRALGDKRGILRAGYFLMPMDETLAIAAVDLSGRAAFAVDTKVRTRLVGDLQTELVTDFFEGFARGARANVHVKTMYGRSNHHKIEAIFKAFARALRVACSRDKQLGEMLPSTKGSALMRVTVIDYKAGNLTSVLKALRHLGAETDVTDGDLVAR